MFCYPFNNNLQAVIVMLRHNKLYIIHFFGNPSRASCKYCSARWHPIEYSWPGSWPKSTMCVTAGSRSLFSCANSPHSSSCSSIQTRHINLMNTKNNNIQFHHKSAPPPRCTQCDCVRRPCAAYCPTRCDRRAPWTTVPVPGRRPPQRHQWVLCCSRTWSTIKKRYFN